ncbi:hypothetical protein BANRA_00009 [Klebsiella pneumoniae]|nr:hypothetical protein BANRA_00009 [Klebsiella pneumoniae]
MKDVVDKCSTKAAPLMSGRSLITRTASTGPRRCSNREEAESTVAAVRTNCAPQRREPPQVDYTIAAAGDAVKLDLSIAFSCRRKDHFRVILRNLL